MAIDGSMTGLIPHLSIILPKKGLARELKMEAMPAAAEIVPRPTPRPSETGFMKTTTAKTFIDPAPTISPRTDAKTTHHRLRKKFPTAMALSCLSYGSAGVSARLSERHVRTRQAENGRRCSSGNHVERRFRDVGNAAKNRERILVAHRVIRSQDDAVDADLVDEVLEHLRPVNAGIVVEGPQILARSSRQFLSADRVGRVIPVQPRHVMRQEAA